MRLKIDRRKWLRGEGNDLSYLLRPYDGKMCCLGFLCASVGVDKSEMTDFKYPEDLSDEVKKPIVEKLPFLVYSREFVFDAALVNDNESIDDTERERRIHDLFSKKGIDVEFVN